MGKIAVLDQNTIDKIAAGEVVERPASVVKELVENAIDAGASQVIVEIREGGIGFIRITDNGSGMEKEDIPLAFLRHSTSKIRKVEDLLGVTSLGFRGEALSSISAVAMVEVITKTRDQVLGNRCYIEGGVQKSLEEIGAPDGTTFIVKNLFYNTPARKKFLKTEMTEGAAVCEIMTHLALSHPEISFKVIINNQMKLQTAGNGSLKDVIYHVYGRDIAMRLIQVDREEGPIHLTGFIGKPEISRGNRNYETYFINGRYVKSKIVAKGIEDGYHTFMMQHRYPFTCLNIQMDGKLLDVNVHPTKMELRFSNQNLVYDTVMRAIKDALSGKELIPEVTLETSESRKAPEEAKKEAVPVREDETKKSLEKKWNTPEPAKNPVNVQEKSMEHFMAQMRQRVEARHRMEEASKKQDRVIPETINKPQMIQEENAYQPKPQPVSQPEPEAKPEQLELFDGKLLSKEAALQHKIIGQLFDTYWLVEFGDKLYMIDQHAAHEKVLYERLTKSIKERSFSSQILSPPIILNLSMQEELLLKKYRDQFTEMGFEIEDFGERAAAVRAVPANLPGIAQGKILMELVDSLSELTGGSSESLMDKLASMSCKAAVKGNHHLSTMEAKALIDELLTLDNPYHCPHGRPTIISMSKYELEKKFKRIV